jgi:outer membrane protein
MNIRKALLAAACISIFLMPGAASAIGVEAALGGWSQDPGGDIAYKGENLGLGSDLMYGSKTRFFGRAKIDMPLFIPNIYLMATPMSFEGTGSKNVPFVFGNRTFNATIPFSSDLRLDHYDIALYYGLPFVKTATTGKLNVDAGLDLRIVDFNASVKQSALNFSEAKSFTLPVPMVYIGAQVKPVDKLSLEAEIRAIAYNSSHFYDLIGRVKYKVFGPAFLSAGYRHESIRIDTKDVKADVRFSGPFAEVGVEF